MNKVGFAEIGGFVESQGSFGNWLRRMRKSRDWTQAELGEQVGCSAATIRKIEAEERFPSKQTAGRLADVFGVDTKEREKFQRFARGERGAGFQIEIAANPQEPLPSEPRSNVPWPATSLVGREQEVTNLCGYLSDPVIRLVTLIGPPGIGKTRLSIAAAHASKAQFRDGVFFIPLSHLLETTDDGSSIATLALHVLDFVKAVGVPAIQQLVKGIREKEMLLVMDNCEHVILSAASLISDLLAACPRLKILATSRETLRIAGEWLYAVPPLTLPDDKSPLIESELTHSSALVLFADRARSVRPNFVLTPDSAHAVWALCERVDALPLGIELIAARVRWLSPQAILDRLDDQWLLSFDGRRAVPDRQKSLQKAIAWSYSLLSGEEQRLFSNLSVFSNGFSLQAAEKLALDLSGGSSTYELVTSLAEKSLIQAAQPSEASSVVEGSPRFSMLKTIQQYASNCLEQMGEKSAAQDWHLGYFLNMVEQAEQHVHHSDQLDWFDHLEREHENIHAALNWGIASQKTEAVLRLLAAVGWFWLARGHTLEMEAFYEKAKDVLDTSSCPIPLARVLAHLGRDQWLAGEYRFAQARAYIEESQTILLQAGAEGERYLPETLTWLAMLARRQDNNIPLSKAIVLQMMFLSQKWEDAWGMGSAILAMGETEEYEKHFDSAQALFEKSLEIYQALGDQIMIARVNLYLDFLYRKLGDEEKARQYYERHIAIDTQLRVWDNVIMDMKDLGNFYHIKGKYEQALALYEKSIVVCESHGIDPFESMFLVCLLDLEWGNALDASQRFIHLLGRVGQSVEKAGVFYPLAGAASAAVKCGQLEQAAVLFGAAQASLCYGMLQSYYLKPSIFDPYVEAQGRAMSLEQAILFARDGQALL